MKIIKLVLALSLLSESVGFAIASYNKDYEVCKISIGSMIISTLGIIMIQKEEELNKK